MSTVRYVGHGVEIEDDVFRLRRRTLELSGDTADYRGDTARRVRWGKPRRRPRGPAGIMSAVTGRWR